MAEPTDFGNELGMPDTLQDASASMHIPQMAFLSSLDSISALQDSDIGDELGGVQALYGEFAMICVAACKISRRVSHKFFADFDSFGLEGPTTPYDSADIADALEPANVADALDSADVIDAADVTDADAFQALTQGLAYSTAGIATQPVVDETPEEPADLGNQDNEGIMEMSGTSETSDTMPTLIDAFPFGSAVAPVSNMPQGPSGYGSSQLTPEETVWTPFWSQCDWEVTHWAKTCNVTSSAVTRLLGITGVRGNF